MNILIVYAHPEPKLDRAVNVYHLRRMKVSSANQVHEIDSFWC